MEEESNGLQAVKSEIEGYINELKAQIKASEDAAKASNAKSEELTAEIAHLREELRTLQVRAGRPDLGGGENTVKTVGQLIVESDGYKTAMDDGVIDTKTITIEGQVRDLTGVVSTGSVIVDNPLRDEPVEIPRRRPRIRDLLTVVPVSGNTVHYVIEDADYILYTELSAEAASGQPVLAVKRTGGFYPDLEVEVGSGTGNAEKHEIASVDHEALTITLKNNLTSTHAKDLPVTADDFAFTPESELAPRTKWVEKDETEPIKKLTTGVTISSEALKDKARLAATINRKLPRNMRLSEDKQILHGKGGTRQLTGLLNEPNRIQYAWNAGPSTDTKADAIARAANLVYLAEYEPNGVIMHPNDILDIKLSKDDEGRYLYRVEMTNAQGEPIVMDLPVVKTQAMPAGKALVGAFDMCATLNDRELLEVRIFDQHEDYAERDLAYVKADQRLCLTIERGKAICEVDLSTPPAA